jgi:hypothetical protein
MIRVAFSFALLRAFAGGYHADTCLKCFMMTLVMCVYTISSIDKLYPALIISGLFMESLSLLVRQNERGRIDAYFINMFELEESYSKTMDILKIKVNQLN